MSEVDSIILTKEGIKNRLYMSSISKIPPPEHIAINMQSTEKPDTKERQDGAKNA